MIWHWFRHKTMFFIENCCVGDEDLISSFQLHNLIKCFNAGGDVLMLWGDFAPG